MRLKPFSYLLGFFYLVTGFVFSGAFFISSEGTQPWKIVTGLVILSFFVLLSLDLYKLGYRAQTQDTSLLSHQQKLIFFVTGVTTFVVGFGLFLFVFAVNFSFISTWSSWSWFYIILELLPTLFLLFIFWNSFEFTGNARYRVYFFVLGGVLLLVYLVIVMVYSVFVCPMVIFRDGFGIDREEKSIVEDLFRRDSLMLCPFSERSFTS